MSKRNYSLKDEAFLCEMEAFISEATYGYRSRLSPVELYTLRYNLSNAIASKKALVNRITAKDLISLFNGNKSYSFILHEKKGLLTPDESFVLFTNNNKETFSTTDLIMSLNKRMTFFIGTFHKKSHFKKDSERKFIVKEVLIYIPTSHDTTLYIDKQDLDKDLFKSIFENDTQFIDTVFQDGVVLSKSPALVVPDFSKEAFIFTNMEIDNSTFIFHYIP